MRCINKPTEELMLALEKMGQQASKKSNKSKEVLEELRENLTQFPAILGYTKEINNKSKIGIRQLQLLLMSVIFRSSSTYSTIPYLLTCLNLVSEYAWASIINKNLNEEAGNGLTPSHPQLLFENFRILGETFNIAFLTPASYSLTTLLHQLDARHALKLTHDPKAFHHFLLSKELYTPEYTSLDLQTASYYYNLGGAGIISYHKHINEQLMNQTSDPRDALCLCTQALELAVREANSVDEQANGHLSFIGSYESVVNAILSKIPEDKRDQATVWFRVHNDVHLGKEAGWQESAEEGHAKDACNLAIYLLNRLSSESFVKVISAVNEICEQRSIYWDYVVKQLKNLEHEDEFLQLNNEIYLKETPCH